MAPSVTVHIDKMETAITFNMVKKFDKEESWRETMSFYAHKNTKSSDKTHTNTTIEINLQLNEKKKTKTNKPKQLPSSNTWCFLMFRAIPEVTKVLDVLPKKKLKNS